MLYQSMLLIGPTGSGKTPLGQFLERKGLWGRRCCHFDFGESLRGIDSSGLVPDGLTERDLGIIHRSLVSGALLENETFYIAKAVLQAFASDAAITREDLLVLNGLPRHRDQAGDMARIITVKAVLYLHCSPATVMTRIRENAGGDRPERKDDELESVTRKLEIFRERTLPLLEYFRRRNVPVEKFSVGLDTGPGQIRDFLMKRPAPEW